jgi:hypothetical protein
MKWVLVFVNIMYNAEVEYKEPVIEAWYEFDTMEDCFVARDDLLVAMGSYNGIPPVNTQLVCIRTEDE